VRHNYYEFFEEERKMKLLNLIALLMLPLALIGQANAALLISANGGVDPPPINMPMGGTAAIGIWGDGLTEPGTFFFGIAEGSIGGQLALPANPIRYPGVLSTIEWINDPDFANSLGLWNPFVQIVLDDNLPKAPLSGTVIDGIEFFCDFVGWDSTLMLFDADGHTLDSQILYETPEPATLLLLGLGAAVLRKRR
jgi:hypothetical protein